jgi:hypothetical protein
MSDISSFAEWEAQQLQELEEGEEVLSERHQKMIDMASEYRIWADRDSSNDFRSSDSDSEGTGAAGNEDRGVELSVNGGGRGMRLKTLSKWEIPLSTMEATQELSQRLEEEQVSFLLDCLRSRRG